MCIYVRIYMIMITPIHTYTQACIHTQGYHMAGIEQVRTGARGYVRYLWNALLALDFAILPDPDQIDMVRGNITAELLRVA
jgi:hypothetical protein